MTIELKDVDEDQLHKFVDFLEGNMPITKRINNLGCHCAKVCVNSMDLNEYLAQYNIVPNKSLTFTIPIDKIPEEYRLDFARGMIDGDGTVTIQPDKQLLVGFCSGNEECVYQMRDILGVKNKISFGSGTYHFAVKGNHVAKAILDKLYENSTENSRLTRKYNIYLQTLN